MSENALHYIENPEQLLIEGKKLETSGRFKSAFDLYKGGLKEFPNEKEFQRRLALMLLNNGNNVHAEKMFKVYFNNNTSPDIDTVLIYGGFIEDNYDEKRVVDFYTAINKNLKSNEIENIINRLNKGRDIEEKDKIIENDKIDIEISPTDIMDVFGYFSGREDNYALQWRDENGKYGYAPANSPLTFNKVKSHLNGDITLGIYQLNVQNQVKWAAFDIDLKKTIVEKKTDEGRNFNFYLYQSLQAAEKIQEQADIMGLKSFIENSGYKGYHVWIFFEEFVSAAKVRKIMDNILLNTDLRDHKDIISVELFPKQSNLSGKKLGNLIKLPFGIHKKSGKRSFFVNKDKEAITSLNDFFNFVKKTSIKDFLDIYKNIEKDKPMTNESLIKNKKVVDLESSGFDILGDPELELLISKCKMLDFIVNKIVWEKECSDDEFNIVKHTLGHLKNGKKIINSILDMLKNTNEDLKLKKSLTGYPVGCKKLKQKVPEITARFDCKCDFNSNLKGYEHPLLHLIDEELIETEISREKADAIKFQNYLDMFLNTRKELKDKAEKLKQIEKRIYKYLNDKGLELIKTKFGVLRKVSHPNGETQLLMEI